MTDVYKAPSATGAIFMTVQTTYCDALRADQPAEALYRHVRALLDGGYSREQAIRDLEALYVDLQEEGPEAPQDAVADVLDSLAGWSSPSAKL
jgi:hypothetical protein